MTMVIRLFTSAFPERREWRRLEFAECLSRNLACTEIDEIVVLVEGNAPVADNGRITTIPVTTRPVYQDYLSRISAIAGADDVSIIANADIYFDESIGLLRTVSLPGNTVLALARWERRDGGKLHLNDRNDSQDAWIFRGRPRPMRADFPVGVPRCDNRLVKELEVAGYSVLNPSFTIRAIHLHNEERDEYPTETRDDFVPGPYGYVWPHNLMSLPRVTAFRLSNPKRQLTWRFDRRYWKRRLRLDLVTRALRAVGLRSSP
jgi:hypothetical protein